MVDLKKMGMSLVFYSPGFRNSPIVLAAHMTKGISIHSVVDERTCGFMALGAAKHMKKPVGLLCTSGSAAGNFLPAIMEADKSSASIIAISADRPARRQKTRDDVSRSDLLDMAGILNGWKVDDRGLEDIEFVETEDDRRRSGKNST